MINAAAVEDLLFAALEKASETERAAFLDSACAGDVELRRQIDKLLKAHDNVGDFLQKPVAEQLALTPEQLRNPDMTTDRTPGATRTDGAQHDGSAAVVGLPDVPGYDVLREIARGGMGRVLVVYDRTLEREIALKVLLPGANPDRFVRESKISARLTHPGIPPVHELGSLADGSPFLAMKLIAGQTLSVKIDTADRPRLLQVFTQVCQAVGFAHSMGVVHRDLKPANIMVGAFGEVQVMDWGLAKDLNRPDDLDEPRPSADPVVPILDTGPAETITLKAAGESTDEQTRAGTILGTPAYMAPEQALGEACDARSDVFALGGILCAILTGQAPYSGKSSVEVIRRARSADLAEAHARLDGCGADAELVALCRRCLSASPVDRPADGQAVADELTAYLNGVQERLQAAQRERAVAMAREAEQRKRRRVKVALAAAVMALMLGCGAVVWWRNAQVQAGHERDTRTDEAVATHLDQGEQALRANDPPRAHVALEAAQKRFAEGGAEKHADRLARLQSDLEVLIELDEFNQFSWTLVGSDFPDEKEEVAQLRKALAGFKLNPESSPEEATALVKGSAVRDRLVAALDYWLKLEQLPWVRAVLQGADPHPYRDAVRDAIRDALLSSASPAARAAARKKLNELVSQRQVAEQPPGFVVVLGEILPAKLRREMLSVTLREHPQNLAMLIAMGASYRPEKKGSAAEQVRWFQAAVAVAPGNGAVHYNLGFALVYNGDLDGAIACFRKAALLAPKTVVAQFYRTKEPTDDGNLDGPIASYPKTNVLDPPTDARAYLILGNVLRSDGDLERAIASYRKAIELEPRYARAYRELGVALKYKGDLDGAIEHFRKAIELEPTYAGAYNSLGIALKVRGDLEGAIAQYHKAIELDPECANAHYSLGNALTAQGDLDGAIAHFRDAVALNPKYVEAYVNLGNALKVQGDLDGAIDSYRKAIDVEPKFAMAYFNLGVALQRKGDLEGAIASYREAIKLTPKYAAAYYNLGNALKTHGDLEEAIASYRKSIELDPMFAMAHYNLALALMAKGDRDGAILHYRKAIDLNPKDAAAHNNLGIALMAKGDRDGAIVHYRKAIDLNPKHHLAHTNLGIALLANGELDGAIASHRKAIEVKPDYATAYYNLGNALRVQGELDGAIDHYRTAIRVDPKYALAYISLGIMLRDQGDPDGAIASLREAIRLAPKNAMAHVYLGFALKDQGDLDGAIDILRKAVELAPKDAWVHDSLGYLLMFKGDQDKAIEHFNTAIRLDSKYAKARDNLAKTKRMAAVQGKLPALLKGDYQPQTNDKRLGLAELCQLRRLYRTSAGLYADAFAADPKVAADLKAGHRYDAANSAALAASGKGEGAAKLDDQERTRLRRQALDWLRADLDLRTRQLEGGQTADRVEVKQMMQYWRLDRDLAGVRGADALAKLPAEQRAAWEKLWADVAALRKKAAIPAPKKDQP